MSTTASVEGVVLTHLLDEHPRRLSLQDLSHEFGDDLDEPTVKRAIDNLAAACLLRFEGSTVVPESAVVNFDRDRPARPSDSPQPSASTQF
jgi:hypothetical protein